LDKPDLTVACVVCEGEAETRPLVTSWHSKKFLNPCTYGAGLPIIHLNGLKIANPTIWAQMALFVGYGYEPILVEGSDPGKIHPVFAKALDYYADKIVGIKNKKKAIERIRHKKPQRES
jgi:xylulose-5-phosphate/fructose-6-phosphate phosphoketolase